jgi:hypothetical protein
MASVDEEVDVVDYDPRWVRLFEHERERICGGISVTPCRIEHIGSTAIPGLIAKPIVDLMLGVEPFPPGSSLIFEIESLGYEALGGLVFQGGSTFGGEVPSHSISMLCGTAAITGLAIWLFELFACPPSRMSRLRQGQEASTRRWSQDVAFLLGSQS